MKGLLIFFFFFQGAFSQPAQKSILGDFNELKAYDGLNVVLIKSDTNTATISGDNQNKVLVINKSGILKLKMEWFKRLKGENTIVRIEHKTPILLIESTQGSKVISENPIIQATLYLKAGSGGQINVFVECEKTRSIVVSGGTITLKGKTRSLEAKARSGGELHAPNLISNQTKASASTGGVCSALAKNIFEADASLGGKIKIYGSPKTLIQQSFLGGIINQINKDE